MPILKTVVSVVFLATSLWAQGPPQKAKEKATSIVFQDIKFVGVKQVPLAELQRIAKEYEGKPLNDPNLAEDLAERVRDVYLQHGFFKAQVERQSPALPENPKLPIVYSVHEGKQYRLNTITFTNAKVFSSATLRPLFPIRAGEIINVAKIRQGLENLRKIYGTRGYFYFTPLPDSSFDEDKRTMSLTIDLDEGKQFKVASVKIFGLDWGRTTRLLCRWPLKPGAIFNTFLIDKFLSENRHWLPGHLPPIYRLQIQPDEKKATVDLSLNFASVDPPTVEVQAKSPEVVFSTEGGPKR